MSLEVTIDPRDLLTIRQSPNRVKKNLRKALFEIGFAVRSTAVRGIQRGPARTGKMRRKRKGRGGRGRASARGEFPKSDTGRLAQSLIATRTGPLEISVGSTFIKYAAFLEFGTRNMDERPFLQPSLDKNKRNITKIVKRRLGRAF